MKSLNEEKNEVLRLIIDEGESQLNKFLKENQEVKTVKTVSASMLRRIIGLSKKIMLNIEWGVNEGIELDYRGIYETYLGFEYIFKEAESDLQSIERRTSFYKVNHYYIRSEALKFSKSQDGFGKYSPQFVIEYTRKQYDALEAPDLKKYSEQYEVEMRPFKNSPYEKMRTPKWFSLDSDTESYNQLAKYIGKDAGMEDLMSEMYAELSIDAHGENCLSKIYSSSERSGFKLEPLIISKEHSLSKNSSVLDLVRAILLKSLFLFTNFIFIENRENFETFMSSLEPRIMKIYEFIED